MLLSHFRHCTGRASRKRQRGDDRYCVTAIALRARATPRRSPGDLVSLRGPNGQAPKIRLGGSARRRFAWANAQAQGPRLRDPPEIRIHDLAPPGAYGRLPTIGDDRCSRGRAHRPGLRGPSRFVPKRRRSHSKLRSTLHSNRGSAQATGFSWPGGSRGSDSGIQGE